MLPAFKCGQCNMEDNVFEIELQKSQLLGFGFSIIGGAGSDLPPVIFDIVAKSPADICGKVKESSYNFVL